MRVAVVLILFLVVFGFLAVCLLRLVQWFERTAGKPNPPFDRAKYLAELRASDWDVYARHLGRKAPAALLEVFGNDPIAWLVAFKAEDMDLEFSFEPIMADSVLDTGGDVGIDIVPFATSICGDPIFLKPGVNEADAVYMIIHDNVEDGIQTVSPDINAFLDALILTPMPDAA